MYNVKVFNKISKKGLDILSQSGVSIISSDDNNSEADVILLRSHKLHDYKFDKNIKAIGRAGAGTNNIPVDQCTENGIVVFNSPGANANAVKELVLSGLFLASRNIYSGLTYVNSLISKECDISSEVEANKSKFKGFEIQGKKLGIIGLGAIGVLVANDAIKLGLDVYGFDPYISVNRAWGLSSRVKQAKTLKEILSKVDFLSFHMPLNDSTNPLIFLTSCGIPRPCLKPPVKPSPSSEKNLLIFLKILSLSSLLFSVDLFKFWKPCNTLSLVFKFCLVSPIKLPKLNLP